MKHVLDQTGLAKAMGTIRHAITELQKYSGGGHTFALAALDVLVAAAEDSRRLDWWITTQKGEYLQEYMRGMREGWTIEQWRVSIDDAMRPKLAKRRHEDS